MWARARRLAGTAAVRHYAAAAPPPRNPAFARLTAADVAALQAAAGGEPGSSTSGDHSDPALTALNTDWTGAFVGASTLALRPASVGAVSAILAYCNARRLAVVPQGGNTGLVGGGVPVYDEVILSTSRLARVLGVDPDAGTLTAEAGCTLAALDAAAAEHGLGAPLDIGARGSCAVGGNLATAAGGARFIRHGPLRASVLQLQAVLADGRVVELGKGVRKDNTGFDLKQLLVGSEGCLGVITRATLAAVPRPPGPPATSFLAVPSWAAACALLGRARRALGESLAAFEFLDTPALEMALVEVGRGGGGGGASRLAPHPLPSSPDPLFILVEASGAEPRHDAEKMETFLEGALGAGEASDGVAASSSAQAAALWALREGAPLALKAAGGAVYKYDVSIPVRGMWGVVEDARARVAQAAGPATAAHPPPRVIAYGHLGDGNLHLNVSAPGGRTAALDAALEPWVYEAVSAAGGSLSAEHGVGLLKAPYLGLAQPPVAIALMRAVKAAFDPHGILNPYKLFPPE
jgi:D-2-hydroxyglutarate dehydrogenase